MIRLLAILLLAPAQAGAFELAFPLDCTLGDSCFIQQFVDHDPGAAAQDFTCGSLTYDGHEGTDFAVPSLAAMQAGVAVRAAAAGTVKGVRDGMPDIASNDPDAPPLDGRDCGNGVVIDHGDGWETQYCHMKQGSVTARTGDPVASGAALGQVGMSGRAEFPHLHVSVRKGGEEIDPFDPDATAACDEPSAPLWSVPIPYQPGGIISAGFATEVPEFAALKSGTASPATLTDMAPALVLWAYAYGSRPGDQMTLAITGPEGEVIRETLTLDRQQAQYFRAIGKRLRAAPWPVGTYTGTATLLRGDESLDNATITVTIAPGG